MNIVLLGSGNVATHLSAALDHAGYNISQVWSRSRANAKLLAERFHADYTDSLNDLDRGADLYIISVIDDAIPTLVKDLSKLVDASKGIWVHTSGTTSIHVFEGFLENHGVFYPLQTFSKSKPVDFKAIPLLVEASNNEVLESLKKIASKLSDRVEEATSDQRKSLHIAAVFACNYTNYLYAIAQELLEDHQLDFDLIRPLIKETADKIQTHNAKEVQTGPAIRGDVSIIKEHLTFLEDRNEWQEVYKLLSDRLLALSTSK